MKRLLSSFFIFLLAIPTLPARTYIVSVGIADYPGRQNDLRVSANDAKTISGIFTKNGNATVDCFVNSDVTIKKVCTAMRNTFAKASPSDAVILYFSGHGVPGGLVCYDGFLYEITVSQDTPVAQGDGQQIIEMEQMSVRFLRANLLEFSITDQKNDTFPVYVSLQSDQ